ncbi:MAG: hypothetical protein KGL39_04200 [Patescibacteria group bacterium]|nr:hypothetical protein [Patescibacteria group bacterium]
MPMINRQRKLHQAGRIRLGEKVETKSGKTIPSKLTEFRFTSSNKALIERLAELYGGEAVAWEDAPTEGQWEVYTKARSLPVQVAPEEMSFSQWYEFWKGPECQRRCDGVNLAGTTQPCICNEHGLEGKERCRPRTRLSVMLADLKGIGMWRLDTNSEAAADELAGAFHIAKILSLKLQSDLLDATLLLEERKTVKDGETMRYVVPHLDFAVNLGELVSRAPGGPELPSGNLTPVTSEPVGTFAQQLDAVNEPKKARRSTKQHLPATGRTRALSSAEAGELRAEVEALAASASCDLHAANKELEDRNFPPIPQMSVLILKQAKRIYESHGAKIDQEGGPIQPSIAPPGPPEGEAAGSVPALGSDDANGLADSEPSFGQAELVNQLSPEMAAKIDILRSALETCKGYSSEEGMIGWVNLSLVPHVSSLDEIPESKIDELIVAAEEEPF